MQELGHTHDTGATTADTAKSASGAGGALLTGCELLTQSLLCSSF